MSWEDGDVIKVIIVKHFGNSFDFDAPKICNDLPDNICLLLSYLT